ncbi:lysM domain receptor-like kinase 3 [Neltuma alba]|uniref:lysM domain receptor-like kinase 3 n=1 Tax=Neltuma alba TaxID=207710 RepID=UPI0010A4418B|nr:lysM domain receptor-like kinase 3 [Prosopis alba]
MCKTKKAINAASPTSTPRSYKSHPNPKSPRPTTSSPTISSISFRPSDQHTTSISDMLAPHAPVSSPRSFASATLRDTLPENPHVYPFSEICSATNNFTDKYCYSSSSTPSWRCTLRGRDVIVYQHKFRRQIGTTQLQQRLSLICRSHHVSIIKLLGASISDHHIHLVYDFVSGTKLADCLRNTNNPAFTVLSNWLSRMQIATDVAHGLDYIHNRTGLKARFSHNHINSSAIIVTEPSFNAKICHFGTAQLCGEIQEGEEIVEQSYFSRSPTRSIELKKWGSLRAKIEGVRGYMSPEYQTTGVANEKSDVYAFGVMMLELLSGEEPLSYKFDKKRGALMRSSVIETARAAVHGDCEGGGGTRKWLDWRLKDSFPIEVAEEATRVALDCVDVDPAKRPDMIHVAGKISKFYLDSKIWSDGIKMPSDVSVSLAPR